MLVKKINNNSIFLPSDLYLISVIR